jgi:hypothetical protein
LRSLDLKRCLFRRRFFLGLKILSDAKAMEPSGHSPRWGTIPILKPADGKLCSIHA